MLVLIVVLATILFDITTKYLTVQLLMPLDCEVTVIPYILNFSYVENRGAAFGMFSDNRWIFMTLSVVLMIVLFYIVKKSGIKHPLFLVSCALVMGGGISNMIDRVFVGYVVDFIKVTFIDFPVFNIADCAVVIGSIMLAIYLIYFDDSFTKNSKGVSN